MNQIKPKVYLVKHCKVGQCSEIERLLTVLIITVEGTNSVLVSQGEGGQIIGTYWRAGCEGSITVSSGPADKKTTTAAGSWRIAADHLSAETRN